MLLLNRKRGESIAIGNVGEQITVTVLEISGKQVKLGFVAQVDDEILRWELWQRLNGAERSAEFAAEYMALPVKRKRK